MTRSCSGLYVVFLKGFATFLKGGSDIYEEEHFVFLDETDKMRRWFKMNVMLFNDFSPSSN